MAESLKASPSKRIKVDVTNPVQAICTIFSLYLLEMLNEGFITGLITLITIMLQILTPLIKWSNIKDYGKKDSKYSIVKAFQNLIECIAPDPKDKMDLIVRICGGKTSLINDSFLNKVFKDFGQLALKLKKKKGLVLQALTDHFTMNEIKKILSISMSPITHSKWKKSRIQNGIITKINEGTKKKKIEIFFP